MPNHIKTILTVRTDDLEKMQTIANRIKGNNSALDFNKFFEMPEALKYNTSPSRIVSDEDYPKIHAEELEAFNDPEKKDWWSTFSITQKMSDTLKKKFGSDNWYDWSIANWGTKWNAYDVDYREESCDYEFQTAWSHPFPIIEKLSQMFPDIEFFVQYADEDMGSNCGEYTIKNGETEDEWYGDYFADRVESLKFAYDVWGMSYDDDYDAEGNSLDDIDEDEEEEITTNETSS